MSALAVSHSSLIASGEKGDNPKIHIWDVHTLKTIHVFVGDHKSDIYLLEFIKDDSLLITCSLRTNTPVVVYNVEQRSIVFSYCTEEQVRRVVPIFTDIQEWNSREPTHKYTAKNFFLFSKQTCALVVQHDLHSNLSVQNMRKFGKLAEITAAVSFLADSSDLSMDNQANPDGRSPPDDGYRDENSAVVVLLTGHVDGKIVRWDNLRPVKELVNYNSAVIEITFFKEFVIVATEDGVIEMRSKDFAVKHKRLDIKNFSYKLMSNSIKNLVITHNSIYFNTYGGDFIKLKIMISSSDKQDLSITIKVLSSNSGKTKKEYCHV